ncbi:MAG TPA: baseplate J/gp47 family protein, partial [candidate division Zixibacteria bacterium]|nr:baseplate J/gp47 family protein [candidate division Zixibacteria bacterium]
MTDYGFTDYGYTPTPESVIEETMQDDYETLTGIACDWSYDSFLGAYNLTVARRLSSVELGLQALSDSRSFNNARQLALDDQGQSRLTARLEQTKTRITLTLTSEADTTKVVPIPTGSVVRGGGVDGRQKWETVEDVEIPAAAGTVNVTAQALEYGAISADPADVTEIVTAINGWASVTNTSAITVGRDVEQDGPYRRRMVLAVGKAGSATPTAIRAKVLGVDGVTACNVIENIELTTENVDGVSLEGKSIAVYV